MNLRIRQQKVFKLKHKEEKGGGGQKSEPSIKELWNNIKQSNICVIGVPEGKGNGKKELFKEIVSTNFPKLMR